MVVLAKPVHERRSFGHVVTRQLGWICIPRRPKLSCRVTDLSVAGALLELPQKQWLPFGFTLFIGSSGSTTRREIRHHRGTRVGVEFVAETHDAAPRAGACADEVLSWRGATAASPARSLLRSDRH